MRVLVFLSPFCIFFFSVVHVLSEDATAENLFYDKTVDSLFPENPGLLSVNVEDPGLEPTSLFDDPDSDNLDWTDPLELAGLENLCETAEEVQYGGRLRARRDANSCSSDQTTNLLKLPGLPDLYNIIKTPGEEPFKEPAAPMPIVPEPSLGVDNRCAPPFPLHFCCLYPEWDKVTVVEGFVLYAVIRQCTPSTLNSLSYHMCY